MAGNNSGAVWMDPAGKSDFDAGLLFLGAIARMMPGLTWQDLQRPQFLAGGFFSDIASGFGNLKDGIGDVLKDTFTTIGGGAGDAVRLATDPQVAGTVSRAATAYATGGGSEGVSGIMEALKNIFTPEGQQAVANVGANYKAGSFSFSNPWVIGGAALFGGLLLVMVAKK